MDFTELFFKTPKFPLFRKKVEIILGILGKTGSGTIFGLNSDQILISRKIITSLNSILNIQTQKPITKV
jgi:hypothetical protein